MNGEGAPAPALVRAVPLGRASVSGVQAVAAISRHTTIALVLNLVMLVPFKQIEVWLDAADPIYDTGQA